MRRLELIRNVRSLTRDLSNSIFREQDIIDWLNEGLYRVKQVVPEMSTLTPLYTQEDEPYPMPEEYHHLLAVYSSARCFGQDERHYQSTTLMNEFEVKLEELRTNIENGTIKLNDPETGEEINISYDVDYVNNDAYWGSYNNSLVDEDDGVEGVE